MLAGQLWIRKQLLMLVLVDTLQVILKPYDNKIVFPNKTEVYVWSNVTWILFIFPNKIWNCVWSNVTLEFHL
jgi:hypothetical protein